MRANTFLCRKKGHSRAVISFRFLEDEKNFNIDSNFIESKEKIFYFVPDPNVLLKMSNNYKEMLLGILEQSPNSVIYMQNFSDAKYIKYIVSIHKELEEQINSNRIIFIPQLNIQDRYNFMKVCDVILDTLTNTTPLYCLLAIKAKKPYITYPQIYYNTRIPYNIYKRLSYI